MEDAQAALGVRGEAPGELGRIAQFMGSNLGEAEPVVPFAAGALQTLEARGEAAGSYGRLRRGFGHVAGELGTLANCVQLRGVLL